MFQQTIFGQVVKTLFESYPFWAYLKQTQKLAWNSVLLPSTKVLKQCFAAQH